MVGNADIIDESQLGGLAEAAGVDGVRAILEAFWESTAEINSGLLAAIAANDSSNVAALGHALKGSSANLGAALLAMRARVIEDAGKAGNFAEAQDALSGIPNAIAETRQAIDEMLTRYE
ncbi:Hpt domain-containing protein [Parvularcula sp. LCG005]|uniref:Hpt domain-containing protein n=1 Tax=Parvularcula sp. LCG005 TaxID=3078805 RepID=UPI00294233A2|nr:Hpt domain-containing protein [Parvularcula sp. LCG005]WOI54119.1 Hpt domain-containing protein [Parvularcula sp. LCG005]